MNNKMPSRASFVEAVVGAIASLPDYQARVDAAEENVASCASSLEFAESWLAEKQGSLDEEHKTIAVLREAVASFGE